MEERRRNTIAVAGWRIRRRKKMLEWGRRTLAHPMAMERMMCLLERRRKGKGKGKGKRKGKRRKSDRQIC
jgi:hypothetical protein